MKKRAVSLKDAENQVIMYFKHQDCKEDQMIILAKNKLFAT